MTDPRPGASSRPPLSGLRRQRWELVGRLYRALEPAFVALSVVWVALVVWDLALGGLPRSLEVLVYVIWGLFIVEFLTGLAIAPSRLVYVRHRWLTVFSLVLPAFRVLRVFSALRALRAVRVVRTVGLLRVATSLNRGLAAVGRTARRRGVGYVLASTAIVIVVGAAGMAFFESPGTVGEARADLSPAQGFSEALWWTAYTMTSGAPTTPVTGEGRLLGWGLSVYGLAVFGYLTAVLASHFVERDRGAPTVSTARRAAPADGDESRAP